jgi:hypothetical protein
MRPLKIRLYFTSSLVGISNLSAASVVVFCNLSAPRVPLAGLVLALCKPVESILDKLLIFLVPNPSARQDVFSPTPLFNFSGFCEGVWNEDPHPYQNGTPTPLSLPKLSVEARIVVGVHPALESSRIG